MSTKGIDFSVKKTLSITRNSLFHRLYVKGKSFAGQHIVVYFSKTKTEKNRLGITVSTKIGNAVIRNRVRRRIKEAYRLLEDNVAPGYNIVIVARSNAKDAPMPEIKNSLEKLLKKSDIWVETI